MLQRFWKLASALMLACIILPGSSWAAVAIAFSPFLLRKAPSDNASFPVSARQSSGASRREDFARVPGVRS